MMPKLHIYCHKEYQELQKYTTTTLSDHMDLLISYRLEKLLKLIQSIFLKLTFIDRHETA